MFNKFKVDEYRRYKKIILPMKTTRQLKDTLRYWRVQVVRDKVIKKGYFKNWRVKTALKLVRK